MVPLIFTWKSVVDPGADKTMVSRRPVLRVILMVPFTFCSWFRSRPPKVSTAPCKLAVFLAEQAIHGERSAHKGRAPVGVPTTPPVAPVSSVAAAPALKTAKSVLDEEGPEAMATWVRQKKGVMVTDTTMRDAHQVMLDGLL